MFHFPGCPPMRLLFHLMVTGVCPVGFPHSDIHGSMPACGSPWLFAAYRVLLRQSVPRHPPCALICLISSPKRPFIRATYSLSLPAFALRFRSFVPPRNPLAFACSFRASGSSRSTLLFGEWRVVSRLQCSCFFLCSFQGAIFRLFPSPRSAFASRASVLRRYGGLKWTRTTDLALIRRVL